MKHILKTLLSGGLNVLSFDAEYSDEKPFHVLVEAKTKDTVSYSILGFLNGKQVQRIAITKDVRKGVIYTPLSNTDKTIESKIADKVDIMIHFVKNQFEAAVLENKQHAVLLQFYDQSKKDGEAYDKYFGYYPNEEDWTQVTYIAPPGVSLAKAIEEAKTIIRDCHNSFAKCVASGHTLSNTLAL